MNLINLCVIKKVQGGWTYLLSPLYIDKYGKIGESFGIITTEDIIYDKMILKSLDNTLGCFCIMKESPANLICQVLDSLGNFIDNPIIYSSEDNLTSVDLIPTNNISNFTLMLNSGSSLQALNVESLNYDTSSSMNNSIN